MTDYCFAGERAEQEFLKSVQEGRLSVYLEENTAVANAALYLIVSELVYKRLTRGLELARGHYDCARSVDQLLPECLDRFEDDVEAVRADLLKHADMPIDNVRGWMVARLNAVTVDANRKRRGERGALQRPRLPRWLEDALDGDKWLATLALEILNWVGVPTALPGGLWPLGAWAERRARETGTLDVTERQVAFDVERVLSAMKRKPAWYEDYIERPLGRKQAPLASTVYEDENERARDFLPGAGPDEAAESWLREYAAEVIDTVGVALLAGADPRTAVVEVISLVFGAGTGHEEIGRIPGSGRDVDENVTRLLADDDIVDRILEVLLGLAIEASGDAK